ncbi:MAG: CPBP family intramembrane metalloprotease [Parachlamydiales bacterium]|nr:CPBP family intramembrane metalloprotease [Candidatus Acheromyda pituitae]
MTAITNHYSLELPEWNCASIAEKIQELDWDTISRWVQLGAVASALGGACALSAVGVLPAAVLVSCAAGVTALLANIVLTNIVIYALNSEEEELETEKSEYADAIKNIPPFITCVAIPIIEELAFRSFIQGGIYAGLSYILPAAAVITIAGFELPVAAVASMVVAGVLFGLAHAGNHPDNPLAAIMHTVTASIAGVFVLGPLYYAFGLWGSALAHIANNTFAIGMGEVMDALSQKKKDPSPLPDEKQWIPASV